MRKRLTICGLVAGALATVGLFAAACGTGGGSTPTSASSAGFEAYRACLAQHGVTLPSRSPGQGFPSRSPGATPSPGDGGFGGPGGPGGFGGQLPEGVDQATFQAAQQACAALQPTGFRGGASRSPGANSAFTAYRNCLADHGVTTGPGQLNSSDPTVAAAEKACAALRPTGRPTPSAS